MQKQELRQQMKAVRSASSTLERERWSKSIRAHIQASTLWRQAKTVGIYASFRGEVDTWGLLSDVLEAGKTLTLPKVVAPHRPLDFHAITVQDGQWPLARGAFGVREPTDDCPIIPIQSLDLLLIPALAVSKTGERLGWGGGYYDRTLSMATSIPTLALVFDCQVVDTLPTDAHDIAIAGWVSERGLSLL